MTAEWYERPFSRDTALQLFDEARNFTTEVIINYMPEVANTWPLGNELHAVHNFNPCGAIVHASHSPSMWNTFHMHTRNSHAAHVIIMAGSRLNQLGGNRYPLLKTLPASILMPHSIMTPIPHSGFMSNITWGVELRTCSKLRPYNGIGEPPPVMHSEETEDIFRRGISERPDEFDFYWSGDLWREKFEGRAYGWEGYYFEKPTQAQVESLIIILMAMNKIAGKMDQRIILPSNCIHPELHPLPIIPWSDIRSIVTADWDKYKHPYFINTLFHTKTNDYAFESRDINYYDEGTIGEQLDIHRWRTYANDGQLEAIDWTENWISNAKKSVMKNRSPVIHKLAKRGYDTSDVEFSTKLYGISRGMANSPNQDIITALSRNMRGL